MPNPSRIRLFLQVLLARLRFVFILLATFLVLFSWQWLRQLSDWVITRAGYAGANDPTVSPDTEYFCPMCPGVVSTWPEKCPVCKMPLVRRMRGEAGMLPEGVAARMQLSPYRLQLAGIRTVPVLFQPLQRTWQAMGRVERTGDKFQTQCEVDLENLREVFAGQAVEVRLASDSTAASIRGTVQAVRLPTEKFAASANVIVDLNSDDVQVPPGTLVEARWKIPLADCEPYRSLPRNPQPRNESTPRQVFICDEHPYYVHSMPGKCVFHDVDLHSQPLAENERLEWVCPVHPEPRSGTANACEQCGGLPRTPQIIRYSPPGHVLAVPESAVIDSGDHRWVFVESGHGMFDAVEIVVGARCADAYPVLDGVHAGQRVVASGAFLLDAETRLNPGLAAAYFGAAQVGPGGASAITRASQESTEALQSLASNIPIADLGRIRQQRVCPVTKFPLGSMGSPPRYRVGEHVVYLCCDGCRGSLKGATELKLATDLDQSSSRTNSVQAIKEGATSNGSTGDEKAEPHQPGVEDGS